MTVDPQRDPSRLQMQTMYNVRDLGGLPTIGGQVTVYRHFVRSDAPIRLNHADLQFLLDYPVRTVVDLRCDNEIHAWPHLLRDQPVVDYFHIPILGNNIDTAMDTVRSLDTGGRTVGLSDLYIHALEHSKALIGQVFSRLANTKPGAVLFHCSLGKDRTGLIASLLLMLANVSEDDIIDNYAISSTYLQPVVDAFIREIPRIEMNFIYTYPENMVRTLTYFHEHYPSPDAYLASCGLTAGELESLRRKMLQ
jgi:protein-tyrosine phosphatase